jgi:hypothetical protein
MSVLGGKTTVQILNLCENLIENPGAQRIATKHFTLELLLQLVDRELRAEKWVVVQLVNGLLQGGAVAVRHDPRGTDMLLIFLEGPHAKEHKQSQKHDRKADSFHRCLTVGRVSLETCGLAKSHTPLSAWCG